MADIVMILMQIGLGSCVNQLSEPCRLTPRLPEVRDREGNTRVLDHDFAIAIMIHISLTKLQNINIKNL